MHKILFTTFLISYYSIGLTQSIAVYINDTISRTEPLKYTETDSVNGKVTAEYLNFPGKIAWSANYYNSYKSGLVKYFYPDGKLMRMQVYNRSKADGEFTQYNIDGKIVIKGEYEGGVKNGFWAYRNYMFMGDFKKGLKQGRWIGLTSEGSKVVLHFKRGVLLHKKKVIMPQVPKSILMEGVIKL